MKLNIRGLLICIIIFILLNSFLANIDNPGGHLGGAYNIIESIQGMLESMEIGRDGIRETAIYVPGNIIVAFLVSALLYITLFARKK